MSRGPILDDWKKMDVICRYADNQLPQRIARYRGISVRTVYNAIASVGYHRCGCGQGHVKDVGACVWATDVCSIVPVGTPGRFTLIYPKRVRIEWSLPEGHGVKGDILDANNAGVHFTFRQPQTKTKEEARR